MQSWLKDYTSFVNSKYGEIEKYVTDMRSLKAEIASVQLRKRQLDVKDSGLQFTFTAPKGGNTNMALDVKTRIREREARRTRRKLDRQKAGIKNHRIGTSSQHEAVRGGMIFGPVENLKEVTRNAYVWIPVDQNINGMHMRHVTTSSNEVGQESYPVVPG